MPRANGRRGRHRHNATRLVDRVSELPHGLAGGSKKPRFVRRYVEGARSKVNGKWSNPLIFPGREFDDLDAYRAAKKQRAAQLAEWRAKGK